MNTIPIISSSHLNWIGFSGFAEADAFKSVADLFAGQEFAVRSEKTGKVVSFHHSHTNCATANDFDIESFVYEGHTEDGNLLTVIIYNR